LPEEPRKAEERNLKMIEAIKKLSVFVSDNLKEKFKSNEEKFMEFHEFHKWLLENIDPLLWNQIGTVNEITMDASNYGIAISVADYKWWAEKFTSNPNLQLKPLKEIQKRIFARILEVSKDINIPGTANIHNTLSLIDQVYLGKP